MSEELPKAAPGTTAVLVFARTLEREGRERFGDVDSARRELLLRGLRTQLTTMLRGTKLPVIHSNERDQRGASFGERLQEACTRAFAQGYAHLIVVGGDCPGLRRQHLVAAAQALEAGQAVLGRDLRGGVYLLGLSAARVAGMTLADLPFQTPVLAEALRCFLGATACDAPVELEPLGDLHERADVIRERRRLQTVWLQRLVRSLFSPRRGVSGLRPSIRRVRCVRRSSPHRGPPCAAHA